MVLIDECISLQLLEFQVFVQMHALFFLHDVSSTSDDVLKENVLSAVSSIITINVVLSLCVSSSHALLGQGGKLQ
jgi:hypothetical protein